MQDSHYFRSQAELFLQLAQQMSDRQGADRFRASAADYLARAQALEGRDQKAAHDGSAHNREDHTSSSMEARDDLEDDRGSR